MDAPATQAGLTLVQQICIYAAPPLLTLVGWFISHTVSKVDSEIKEQGEDFSKFKEKYEKDQEELKKKFSNLVSEVRKEVHKQAMEVVAFQKGLHATLNDAQQLVGTLQIESTEHRKLLNMLHAVKEKVEILTLEVQDVKDLPVQVENMNNIVDSMHEAVRRVQDEQTKSRIFVVEKQKESTGRIILLEDIAKRQSQALSGASKAIKAHEKELAELKKKVKDVPEGSGHG